MSEVGSLAPIGVFERLCCLKPLPCVQLQHLNGKRAARCQIALSFRFKKSNYLIAWLLYLFRLGFGLFYNWILYLDDSKNLCIVVLWGYFLKKYKCKRLCQKVQNLA